MQPPAYSRSAVASAGAEPPHRLLLVLDPQHVHDAMGLLRAAGLRVARTDDGDPLRAEEADDADVLLLPHIGMAIVSPTNVEPGQLQGVVRPGSPVVSVHAERTVAFGPSEIAVEGAADGAAADAQNEWFLVATSVHRSTRTGAGTKVAILDTGMDFSHPDLAGRVLPGNSQSFVWGVNSPQDDNGHGTHTSGLVGGPAAPQQGLRYGVATGCELLIGKVLTAGGFGADGEVLAGLDWAVQRRAEVIVLALEVPVGPNQGPSAYYEHAGSAALNAGCLPVAAVGNLSNRPHTVRPISSPADCRSFLGVNAFDPTPSSVLWFRDNGTQGSGMAQVDLIAPGVQVRSVDLRARAYSYRSGTSMGTAITAGIAALAAEAIPAARGAALGAALKATAFWTPGWPLDAGAGLVQAPA